MSKMSKERLYLFDTTLRDGAQMNGVDFTIADKVAIAGMLDELGLDYVEGGYPGANPTDTELFSKDRKLGTTFTAFTMTPVANPGCVLRPWNVTVIESALNVSASSVPSPAPSSV